MSKISKVEDILSLTKGSRISLHAENNEWLDKMKLYDYPTLADYQFEISKELNSKEVKFQDLRISLLSRTHTLAEIQVKASDLMDGNWYKI